MSHFFAPHFAAIDAIDFHGCCLTRASLPPLLEILEAEQAKQEEQAKQTKQTEKVPLSICALNLSGERWRGM